MARPIASFVTLEWRKTKALHGCIGSIDVRRNLDDDVRANACLAAFEDPRSRVRIGVGDLAALDITVAVLGPLEPFVVSDEADALAKLRPGVDGVLLRHGRARGVFLPKVWDKLPTPHAFLGGLRSKAGLAADVGADGIELWRDELRHFSGALEQP